ncbi:Protein boule-like protein [Pteropus alecto]|uniref:Protein boule-like protein n=1 Tax=Pteropus alecto TaxID=9402 RepID=L5K235_PTEAL|nr:Protein boule-like protein [Pteropus alecto]
MKPPPDAGSPPHLLFLCYDPAWERFKITQPHPLQTLATQLRRPQFPSSYDPHSENEGIQETREARTVEKTKDFFPASAQDLFGAKLAEKLNYKDKKLNIGPAIRKQQVGIPRSSVMPAAGTMYLTTSTGYPYTYHNGVAYFHTPEVTSVPPPWPSRSISSSPVMVAQPVYQQPAYHYQSPASSAPFLYLQPSEVIYQPVEIAQDGGCVPPPLSLMDASVPEPYSDHGVQATYHQVYAPSAITMPAPVMQTEPIKVRSLF